MRRSAFTLIEMLVAVAITMIMMLAIAQLFMYFGDGMQKSRANIEMSGQLRNLTHRLQQDLDGLTASTLPWTKSSAGDGYFEYIEGAGKDKDSIGTANTMLGDGDDVLAFTARSSGHPFAGRHGGNVVESQLAEIIWWASPADASGLRTLHRRILLIRPDLTATAADDISRSPATGKSNSLADLTLRENRALHAATYPHAMNTAGLTPDTSRETVLSNVVAFDVRAWDSLAPLMAGASSALTPGDPGYAAATAFVSPIGKGAYVDLGYAGNQTTSLYSGVPSVKSGLTTPTYSTWPFQYEHDGSDQDGDGVVDEGTDGFDTPAVPVMSAADDPGEHETSPPYPHPITGYKSPGLRGIQVRIRMAEPSSRQVRQSTVVAEFLPE